MVIGRGPAETTELQGSTQSALAAVNAKRHMYDFIASQQEMAGVAD